MAVEPYLPGAVFIDLGPDGGPYDETGHPKGCVHTTEGSSLAGAEAAFADYPPHLGYDPVTRELHQYVRLDRYAMALRGDESDDEFMAQIEVVGYASGTANWPAECYTNFGIDVVAPLRAAMGIPDTYLEFFGADCGFTLASPNSPIRLSDSDLRNFSGWLGHQHVPAPDEHWDPGGFVMSAAIAASYGNEEDFLSALADWEQRRLYDRIMSMAAGVEGQSYAGEQYIGEQGRMDEVIARLTVLETEVADLTRT